jgi:type 1 glutamine amidotransferase
MSSQSSLKVLYITGGEDKYHNFDAIADTVSSFLTGEGHVVTVTRDLDYLLPESIINFDLIISYSINLYLTKEHEDALLKAIIGSPWGNTGKAKGFIGLHGASFTFLNSPDYIKMLGGKLLGHPEIGQFDYTVENPQHPIMAGVQDFSMNSELYLMETYPPYELLLSGRYNGFDHPIAWVKPYGLGRIFYCALGHDENEFKQPEFQMILRNAVLWSSR